MSIRAMSVFLQNTSTIQPESSKSLLEELLHVVKECQTKYGGKPELATEQDERIDNLCRIWEKCLSHGMKLNLSIFKNVADIMTGTTTELPSFWDVAVQHLTKHEQERFTSLRYVRTDRGKIRALIRAALNEHSLERYVLCWLNDINLTNVYEEWALMRDDETTNLLPSIAAGLNSILFAITVDCLDLNLSMSLSTNNMSRKTEPIIFSPHPIAPSSAAGGSTMKSIKQNIISFDVDDADSISPASSACGSVPKSLSNICLKYPVNHFVSTSLTSSLTTFCVSNREDKEKTIKCLKNQVPNDIIYAEPESPSTIHIVNGLDEPGHNMPANSDELEIKLNETKIDKKIESFENYLAPITSSSSSSRASETSLLSDSFIFKRISNVTSTDTQQMFVVLKAQLQETLDRCEILESRVAELSLENHRLRGFHRPSRHAFNYFSVSLPRVLLQRQNHRRTYYAYEVHIIPSHDGDEWMVLRRYSDFYKLHKHVQKDNVTVKTLDFPPKKKFGNMDAHFVEQRRQRLQLYLRHLLAVLPDVSSCTTRSQLEQVFPFFAC